VRVTRYPRRADTPASSTSINLWISRAGLGGLRWRHHQVRQGLAALAMFGEAREVISADILGTYNSRGGSVTAVPELAAHRTEPCWMTATTAAIDYRGQFKMCCCVYPEADSGHDRYVVGSLRDATFAEPWWSPQMDRYSAGHAAADWSASPACAACRQQLPATRR
jgi:Iron-sulfur cluster-binding domain